MSEKGDIFDIEYYAGEVPVVYGQEPYTWVNAVSPGLKVVCRGPEFRVSSSRQRKPLAPDWLMGEDGAYRRALRIAINGDDLGNNADYYIHIMGDLVVVGTDKLRCADLCSEESLTPSDRALMAQIRGDTV